LSFTAISISCSEPGYRSVVRTEECPEQKLDLLQIAAAFPALLAQVVGTEVFYTDLLR
jgi:hypothetical protein